MGEISSAPLDAFTALMWTNLPLDLPLLIEAVQACTTFKRTNYKPYTNSIISSDSR